MTTARATGLIGGPCHAASVSGLANANAVEYEGRQRSPLMGGAAQASDGHHCTHR
jgi:hypothetical protein